MSVKVVITVECSACDEVGKEEYTKGLHKLPTPHGINADFTRNGWGMLSIDKLCPACERERQARPIILPPPEVMFKLLKYRSDHGK